MKVWQDMGWEKRLGGLSGESLRVLHFLLVKARFWNIVPGPAEVALLLGMLQPNASRSYAELLKADFLCKQKGVFSLHPLFCWKGTDAQWKEAVYQMQKGRLPRRTRGTRKTHRSILAEAERILRKG